MPGWSIQKSATESRGKRNAAIGFTLAFLGLIVAIGAWQAPELRLFPVLAAGSRWLVGRALDALTFSVPVYVLLAAFLLRAGWRRLGRQFAAPPPRPDWHSYTSDVIWDCEWQWRRLSDGRVVELLGLCRFDKNELRATHDFRKITMNCSKCGRRWDIGSYGEEPQAIVEREIERIVRAEEWRGAESRLVTPPDPRSGNRLL
jgi:hypothetical protein